MIKVWYVTGEVYQIAASKAERTEDGRMQFSEAGRVVGEVLKSSDVLAWALFVQIGAKARPAMRQLREQRKLSVSPGRATPKQRHYLAVLIGKNPNLDCGLNPEDSNLTQAQIGEAIAYLKGEK